VLAAGDDFVVLWKGDTVNNGAINLSELQRIELDSDTGELWSFRAPGSLDAGDDTTYEDTADFAAITDAITGTAHFPATLWGKSVTHFTVTEHRHSVGAVFEYELSFTDTDGNTVTYQATFAPRCS
jgi:hypothetical protein